MINPYEIIYAYLYHLSLGLFENATIISMNFILKSLHSVPEKPKLKKNDIFEKMFFGL